MRTLVVTIVEATLERLVAEGDLPAWPERPRGPSLVDVPRSREHGDWASNAAMVYAKVAKRRPQEVATLFRAKLVDPLGAVASLEIAGPGFLNFRLSPDVWWKALADVETQGKTFGRTRLGEGKRVDVEFVSANPTGPMHVGHGRGAVTGDAIASLLTAAGYSVTREYYINDAGNQIDTLARSVHLRYRELFGESVELPEGSYPGEYVSDIARALRDRDGDRYLRAAEDTWLRAFGDFAVERVLEMIRGDLAALGIRFDVWFSERKQIQESGALAAILEEFRKRDLIYDKDGAVFFRSTRHGDDKDRPVIKSNGQPTYLAGDIAYAKDKFERGYAWCLNVWGADHHGAIPRLRAAIHDLGYDPQRLRFTLVQMVNLLKDGQPFKMSKRAGTVVSLREVIDEVGGDATRFFFLLRKSDTQLDFDIGLAKAQSNDNPVYYVQYGHARLCAILRKAAEQGVPRPRWDLAALRTLGLPEELELAKRILALPDLVEGAAEALEPHRVVFYLQETVAAFHGYYTRYRATDRVIGPDPLKTAGRLYLCDALRQAMANALGLLGVSAPERMERDEAES